jgi:hypothetical protein
MAVTQNNTKYTYYLTPKTMAHNGSTLLLHYKIQFTFIVDLSHLTVLYNVCGHSHNKYEVCSNNTELISSIKCTEKGCGFKEYDKLLHVKV